MPGVPFLPWDDRVPGAQVPAYDPALVVTGITPNSDVVAGGATVTITGSGFIKDTLGAPPSIFIGGGMVRPDLVTWISDTTMTFVVPEGPSEGVFDVTVTRGDKIATLPGAFTYANPFVNTIDPNNGPLVGGTDVMLTGGNFVTGATVLFGDTPGTDVRFVDANHILVTTPVHAVGAVKVSVDGFASAENFYFTLLTRGEDIRRNPGISINEQLGSSPNSCRFTVDGESFPPRTGELVEITDEQDGDRLLFAGIAQSVNHSFEDDTRNLVYNVNAVDFVFWLNRRRPFGTYLNTSVTDVVKDLVAKYAPWVDTSYVQTGLCNVNVSFDGNQDFSTCLNTLARLIGAGHWYLDYRRQLHFFHFKQANGVESVTTKNPSGRMKDPTGEPGIGQPGPVLAVSATPAGTWNQAGFGNCTIVARTTFVYSNGFESSFSLISNALLLQATQVAELSGISTGASIGGLAVVARRVYIYQFTGRGSLFFQTIQINDNTTTTLTALGNSSQAFINFFNPGLDITLLDSNTGQTLPIVARPPGPTAAPGAAQSATTLLQGWQAEFPGMTGLTSVPNISAGYYQFRVSYVYRDGTESELSLPSPSILLDGSHGVDLNGLVPGPAVETLDVVYRKVYGSMRLTTETDALFWTKGHTFGCGIIRDNTSTTFTAIPKLYNFAPVAPATSVKITGQLNPPSTFSVDHSNPDSHTFDDRYLWGGVIETGWHDYAITFVNANGETTPSNRRSASFSDSQGPPPDAPNGALRKAHVWQLPYPRPVGVTAIKIYRTIELSTPGVTSADARKLRLLTTINDDITQSYIDNTPDADLGEIAPTENTSGLRTESTVTTPGQSTDGSDTDTGQENLLDACGEEGENPEDQLDQPNNIDDSNEDLLKDPPLTTSFDISQVRNRVYVRGNGTVTTADAAVGATSVPVAACDALPPAGGTVLIGSLNIQLKITGLSATSGAGFIVFDTPLSQSVPSGTPLRGVCVLEDKESQKYLAQIEVDSDGFTDGVHETFIDDSSLLTYAQMVNRGTAELELFAWPTVTVRYSTRDSNSHPGRQVNIDLTDPPLKGTFLIQEVSIDQIHDESDQLMPRYTVSASSSRFNLDDLLVLIAGQNPGMGSTNDFSNVSSKGILEVAVTNSVASSNSYTDNQLANFSGDGSFHILSRTLSFDELNSLNSGGSDVELLPALGSTQAYLIYRIMTICQVTGGSLGGASRNLSLNYNSSPGTVAIVGSSTFFANGSAYTNSSPAVSTITNTANDFRGASVFLRGTSTGTLTNSNNYVVGKYVLFYSIVNNLGS